MTARRIALACALLALAGCDDRIGDYPELLPTDQILAEPNLPAHAAESARDPSAATAGLTSRASALKANTPGQVANDESMSGRADALRARADALAQTQLDACPEGAACTRTAAPAPADDDPDLTRRIEELRARSDALTAQPQAPCPEGTTTCALPETPKAVVTPEE
ncbi:hypothetical protein [Paracoccus ravus]|uniref:hypothetical protein n=1 Tax=Paracoccus ravus TaxID=2447760 RepID=UPI001ADC1F15|nr:hypothetical protein [Paracoccus ravus]